MTGCQITECGETPRIHNIELLFFIALLPFAFLDKFAYSLAILVAKFGIIFRTQLLLADFATLLAGLTNTHNYLYSFLPPQKSGRQLTFILLLLLFLLLTLFDQLTNPLTTFVPQLRIPFGAQLFFPGFATFLA